MTWKSDLYALLGPLVSARCYPNTFVQPDGTLPPWPAIRYTSVGGEIDADICGSGDLDSDSVRVQIDVVTETALALETLLRTVRISMRDAIVFEATLNGTPDETWDFETRTHRASCIYTIDAHSG